MDTGAWVGVVIGVSLAFLIIGVVATFFVVKKMFEKQIKENPPVTEKMIRAMFLQMGRKPSESQIKAVMRSMTNAKENNNKK